MEAKLRALKQLAQTFNSKSNDFMNEGNELCSKRGPYADVKYAVARAKQEAYRDASTEVTIYKFTQLKF